MDLAKKWHDDLLKERLVKGLEKNGFEVQIYPDCQAALTQILASIPLAATVGIGGSKTLQEVGLPEALARRGNLLYDHSKASSPEEAQKIRRQQLGADIFLTSTNALTLDGKLVNTDGVGNRVAAMTFGPARVIVVCGLNKLVADVPAAMQRIENIAAPINAKRLNKATPCTQTGYCCKCNVPDNICRVTTIFNKKPSQTKIEIVVIEENLGY